MWRYLRDWGLSIALAAAVYLAIVAFRPKPDLPDVAPDFQLEDLSGQTHTLSDYRGQWVVVNFWATWCGPCLREIPTFNEFHHENPDVPVLGIATDGTPAGLRAFAAKYDMDYPVLVADQETMATYGVDTLPTTIVVGPDGQVETIHVGEMFGWQLDMAVD